MSLRSRLELEICRALQTLLVFSADPSVSFELYQHPELMRELLRLWVTYLDDLDNGHDAAPFSRFWTYEELFEIEESAVLDSLDPLCNDLAHTTPYAESGDDVPKVTLAAERSLMILCIFRNWSTVRENQAHLAADGNFVDLVWRCLGLQPSASLDIPAVLIKHQNIDPRDRHMTFLQHRQNALMTLQNIIAHTVIGNRTEFLAQVMTDFLSTAFGNCSDEGLGASLVSNAMRCSQSSDYAVLVLDVLANATILTENRRQFEQLSAQILKRLVRQLLSFIPIGAAHYRRSPDQSQDDVLPIRWSELVELELALLCLSHLASISSSIRIMIAGEPGCIMAVLRVMSGLCWQATPVYSRDPEYANSALAAGIQSVKSLQTSDQTATVILAELSRKSSILLTHLAKDSLCLPFFEEGTFFTGTPKTVWGAVDRWSPMELADSSFLWLPERESLVGSAELTLFGLAFQCRPFPEAQMAAAQILYHLAMHRQPTEP
jgi:hypothetical protein